MTTSTTSDNFPVARGALVLAAAVLAFLGALSVSTEARSARLEADAPEISAIPNPQTVRALSLGYETFVADLLWIATIQRHDKRSELDTLERYVDVILYLDPDFERVYQWAGNTLVLAGGRTSPENVAAAKRVLERGMQRYPDEAYYPYTIALNYAFYHPTSTADERDAVQQKAVEYLQMAMQRRNAPRGIALLIAGLIRSATDDPDAVNDFLEQAYMAERDPEVRKKIEARMLALGGERLRLFERQRRARREWLETRRFAHLPPGLAFQLGERVDTFDTSEP